MFKPKFTSIAILAIITIIETVKMSTNKIHNEKSIFKIKQNKFYITNMENIIKMSMILKSIENSSEKVKQKMVNKIMHSTYGNREKEKKYNHYKLMNINKGSSDFKTYQNELKAAIEEKKSDIITITESNLADTDKDATKPYADNFNVENKVMDGMEKSRVTCLIRKGIKYERLKNYELTNSSMIFVKIKCSRRRSFTVVSYYREWQQKETVPGHNTRSLDEQLHRLEDSL